MVAMLWAYRQGLARPSTFASGPARDRRWDREEVFPIPRTEDGTAVPPLPGGFYDSRRKAAGQPQSRGSASKFDECCAEDFKEIDFSENSPIRISG
jgi:hypothetical protein